jgi:hypothetical protein
MLWRMFVPVWNKVHKRMLPVIGREEGMALIVRKTKAILHVLKTDSYCAVHYLCDFRAI